jgi:DNA-binding beta-propeller fold protein YncE
MEQIASGAVMRRPRRMGRAIVVAVSIAVLTGGLTVAPRAQADTGDLRFVHSVPQSRPTALAASPDGTRLFVGSQAGIGIFPGAYLFTNVLTVYARGPGGGSLGFSQCFGTGFVGSNFCTHLPDVGDERATDVAVSPDGQSVFVTTMGNSLLYFQLDPATNRFAFRSCYHNSNNRPNACGFFPGVLDSPQSLAVTDAGQRSLFVRLNSGISWFTRELDGRLSFAGCFVSKLKPQGSCGTLDLNSTTSMEVAPDGQSVLLGGYPAAGGPGILFSLDRSVTSAALTFGHCLQDGNAQCAGPLGGGGSVPATDIAFSPDGNNAYLTHGLADTVTTLTRAGSGSPFSFDSCHTDVDKQGVIQGCTFTTYIAHPKGVDVSGDGSSVYVTGSTSASLATFNRGAGGRLTPDQCFVDGDPADPRCLKTPGLDGATDVDVIPSGSALNVAADVDHVITTFTRQTSNSAALLPPLTPGQVDTAAPETSLDSAVAGKGKTVTLTFSSPEPGATFECALDGEAAPCVSPLELTLKGIKPGSHTLTVTAIDAAGNRDESPATQEFTWRRGRKWKRIFPDTPVSQS